MLILTRKSGESVIVGGGEGFPCLCKVKVLEIAGGKVRLGFEVDQGVPVNREEVWNRLCEERGLDPLQLAAQSFPPRPRAITEVP